MIKRRGPFGIPDKLLGLTRTLGFGNGGGSSTSSVSVKLVESLLIPQSLSVPLCLDAELPEEELVLVVESVF